VVLPDAETGTSTTHDSVSGPGRAKVMRALGGRAGMGGAREAKRVAGQRSVCTVVVTR